LLALLRSFAQESQHFLRVFSRPFFPHHDRRCRGRHRRQPQAQLGEARIGQGTASSGWRKFGSLSSVPQIETGCDRKAERESEIATAIAKELGTKPEDGGPIPNFQSAICTNATFRPPLACKVDGLSIYALYNVRNSRGVMMAKKTKRTRKEWTKDDLRSLKQYSREKVAGQKDFQTIEAN
jgi:hypothetical protein